MVRTKFSEDDKVGEAVRQDDGNNEKNNEIVTENGVVETGADVQQAKVVSAPMALNRIVPIYPRSARRRGQEGVVTLEITVSDSGAVTKADVIGSSGHSNLDHAAVSAVNTARFAPATEDGVRIEGRLRLTFEFKLR
jgi:protein TonB